MSPQADSDAGFDVAPQLLLVEDDEAFARTLARSFERRGYAVTTANSLPALQALLEHGAQPGYAVVDLKLKGQASGLACVQALHAHDATIRIVVLTGFASIATAVEAVKLGACHYLAKPSNTDDIEAAFARTQGQTDPHLTARQSSIKTLGAHTRNPCTNRVQHFRDCPPPGHASTHPGAQVGQAAGEISTALPLCA